MNCGGGKVECKDMETTCNRGVNDRVLVMGRATKRETLA